MLANLYNEKPLIYVKFLEKEIFGESGRLIFAILNIFSLNAYQIRIFDNNSFNDLGKYAVLGCSIDNVTMTSDMPTNTENSIYLYDQEDKNWKNKKWQKKVQIKFDIFSPYAYSSHQNSAPLMMPYPMHPLQYKENLDHLLLKYRKNEKKLGVFFSGDMKGYTKSFVQYPKQKLSRTDVVQTIVAQAPGDVLFIQDDSSLAMAFEQNNHNKCVIVNTEKVWVDEKDWLENISRAHFFLCPPGICMPMCHNVIEAMAVGAIPIINYPEWFSPGLKHLHNCIVFDDKEDLVKIIQDVLSMDQEHISNMRKNVIEYYENHLIPAKFISRIESSDQYQITILMIIEKYVRHSAAKLNQHSILFSPARKPFLNSLLCEFLYTIKS